MMQPITVLTTAAAGDSFVAGDKAAIGTDRYVSIHDEGCCGHYISEPDNMHEGMIEGEVCVNPNSRR